MILGIGFQPGVLGTNPDITAKNVDMQFDYRQIYAHVLTDWFEVDPAVVSNDILFGDFINGANPDGGSYSPLPLIRGQITSTEDFLNERFRLEHPQPNPARDYTVIRFRINRATDVSLVLYDLQGRPVRRILAETRDAGEHAVRVDLQGLSAGIYLYEIQAGILRDSKRLVIRK